VFFALLAIAFVALWVRSYFYNESILWVPNNSRYSMISSRRGSIGFEHVVTSSFFPSSQGWKITSAPVGPVPLGRNPHQSLISRMGFNFQQVSQRPLSGMAGTIPHWFLAACSLGLAALFAFKRTWRYSLRTILVATTVLAAILGLAVYVG